MGAAAGASVPAAEIPALLEEGESKRNGAWYEEYAKTLRVHEDLGSLSSTTSELEGKMATVKSDIQTLQNQVAGNAFSASSLLETKAEDQGSKTTGSSLSSRVVALEHEVQTARTQV